MFDFKKLNITNDDITFVESRFGFRFNEGQKKIIEFWDSIEIPACPGSGKTTTLAAKLMILANKIPKSFIQGICVITHTNVAVEEIKSKLDSYSSFYFNYPNHFGTIQSFVDKYLTIPAYKNEFKQLPKIIDTDSYCKEINKFKSLSGTALFLRAKGIDEIGHLSFNKSNFNVSKTINEEHPFTVHGISAEKMKVHYDRVKEVKLQLFREDGYIKYEEAYSMAFKYLRENPNLKSLFSKRFPLVFIDEMQDMETHQSEILNLLFDGTATIVQKIGDINQSIYSYYSSKEQNEWKPNINCELQLTETARIANNIVQIVKDICLEPQEMIGWTNPTPLNPTIIVYQDNSILSVKNKFGELLIQNNIYQGGFCKAVGARLSGDNLNINSYWHEFNRGHNKKDFTNIVSFLENSKKLASHSKNVKEIRKSLLSILCKCLRLCKIKNPTSGFYFTPFTLVRHLNSLDDISLSNSMNNNIAKWIKSISETKFIKGEIEKYSSTLISSFGGQENEELKQFFTNPVIESYGEKIENKIYTFTKDGNEVEIHFDTIHGVKSETHKATLFLETYTNKVYDIGGKILKFVMSNETQKTKNRKDNSYKKRLPLAYVAMTRATHFICLTVHKDRFTDNLKTYFEGSADWDVIYL